jgi:hypothetical protein
VAEAFGAYNTMAKAAALPLAQALNPDRRAKLRSRLTEVGGLAGWEAAMDRVRDSPFLLGHVPGRDGADPFRADLDFLLQRKNFTRLMEGFYARRTAPAVAPGTRRPVAGSADDTARRRAGLAAAFADVVGT